MTQLRRGVEARARKELNPVRETCYCGRSGDLEDRQPVAGARGQEALRCPSCGHLDYVHWLAEDARRSVFEGARRRHHGERMPLAG